MAAIIVGVISDIHGVLSKNATKELASCDVILCAGDVEREFILMELDAIAPTIAVKGNCDYPSISSDVPLLPLHVLVEFDSLWCIVLKISARPQMT